MIKITDIVQSVLFFDAAKVQFSNDIKSYYPLFFWHSLQS